jgi:predicted kinase
MAPQRVTPGLREVETRQARFFETHADCFLAREVAQRVLARAVSLRLEDVVLRGSETARIRTIRVGRPGDVCVELAGLTVDLRVSDLASRAERLLSHYAGEADDFDLYGVVEAFECACALERAAEAAHAATFASAASVRDRCLHRVFRLVSLAVSTGRQGALPPIVVSLGGQVATGKSTIARMLADELAAPRIVGDRMRRQLVEDGPHDTREARSWKSLDPSFHDRLYSKMLQRAEPALASGRVVVLDGCFPRARDRAAARALARRHGVAFRFVECRVDAETQRRRLAERDAGAERPDWNEIARAFATDWEPVQELPPDEHVVLDTAAPIAQSAAALRARLPSWPPEPGS